MIRPKTFDMLVLFTLGILAGWCLHGIRSDLTYVVPSVILLLIGVSVLDNISEDYELVEE